MHVHLPQSAGYACAQMVLRIEAVQEAGIPRGIAIAGFCDGRHERASPGRRILRHQRCPRPRGRFRQLGIV